jgi:hypothetical protein
MSLQRCTCQVLIPIIVLVAQSIFKFTAKVEQDLGVVKRRRKKRPPRAGLSPSKENLTIPVFA